MPRDLGLIQVRCSSKADPRSRHSGPMNVRAYRLSTGSMKSVADTIQCSHGRVPRGPIWCAEDRSSAVKPAGQESCELATLVSWQNLLTKLRDCVLHPFWGVPEFLRLPLMRLLGRFSGVANCSIQLSKFVHQLCWWSFDRHLVDTAV
jgi:hypothetical protein